MLTGGEEEQVKNDSSSKHSSSKHCPRRKNTTKRPTTKSGMPRKGNITNIASKAIKFIQVQLCAFMFVKQKKNYNTVQYILYFLIQELTQVVISNICSASSRYLFLILLV